MKQIRADRQSLLTKTYEILCKKETDQETLRRALGLKSGQMPSFITEASWHYPIYEYRVGRTLVYGVLGATEYGDKQ